MKKKVIENSTLKVWLRRVAIAAAILMFIVIVAMIFLNFYTRHGERYTVPSFVGMTIDEAKAASEGMEINFDVVDSIYVEAMAPGVILDQYPKAGNFIKSGRRVTITTNTFVPKNVNIPYVTGYSLRQAKNRLQSAGLQIGQLIYVHDIAENNVVRQVYNGIEITPKSNMTVPVNSKVILYVGSGENPTTMRVPSVIGEPLYIGKNRLLEDGLNIEIREHESMSRMEAQKAIIYKQYPIPGDSMTYGGVVSLYISNDTAYVAKSIKSYHNKLQKLSELREILRCVKTPLEGANQEDLIEQQLKIEEINSQIDSLMTK